jgi:chromosome segregation ATPase
MQLNEGAKGILEELKKVRSEKMSLESNLTELQSDLTDLQEAYQQQVAGRSGGPKKSETSSALSARSANSLFGPNK